MPSAIITDLPSRDFQPRVYGVGAWTEHIHFAYDLVALEQPALLVELGTDRGESYFAFCQSAVENKTNTRCFAVDTWKGDAQSGFHDETTLRDVSAHNARYYASFSTLLPCQFDEALDKFADGSIDILHMDGLHSAQAVRRDLRNWLPKLKPGGLLLIHDIAMRRPGFSVWKVWNELRRDGRVFAFQDGPGLGVWENPPERPSRFRELFLEPESKSEAEALVAYYREQNRKLQEQIAHEWQSGAICQTAFAQETIIQIFYAADGTYREENSAYARIGHGSWKDIAISLPANAGATPLRIDFVSALTVIDIARLRVTQSGQNLFAANTPSDFDKIDIRGDAHRLANTEFLRFNVDGVDPQLYLPPLAVVGDEPLRLEMRLCVRAETLPTA